jgi:hypothetical protein
MKDEKPAIVKELATGNENCGREPGVFLDARGKSSICQSGKVK